jgi:hypothetical protein
MDPNVNIAVSVAAAVVAFIVFTLIFRWIWNRTMPPVFGVREVTFWQAIGILVLASILFGGHRVVNSDFTAFVGKRVHAAPVPDMRPV